jgi:hypothetical protein
MQKPGLIGRAFDSCVALHRNLAVVMMTMMVTNRSIGGSNRTHQNCNRENRKQNATKLHCGPSPKTSVENG